MWKVFLFGFLLGGLSIFVSCMFGRFLVKHKKTLNQNNWHDMLQEFSSGLMMATVTFGLLPVAIDMGGVLSVCAGLLAGCVSSFLLRASVQKTKSDEICSWNSLVHCIPEGLAIGLSFVTRSGLSVLLWSGILLHHIPSGVFYYNIKNKKMLLFVFLCACLTGISAMTGSVFGTISPLWSGFVFGLSGGFMLCGLTRELSRKAKMSFQQRKGEIVYILGLVTGILLK